MPSQRSSSQSRSMSEARWRTDEANSAQWMLNTPTSQRTYEGKSAQRMLNNPTSQMISGGYVRKLPSGLRTHRLGHSPALEACQITGPRDEDKSGDRRVLKERFAKAQEARLEESTASFLTNLDLHSEIKESTTVSP